MKRKAIAMLLALSALFSIGSSVCAYNGENLASPYYLYTSSVESTLTVVSDTAYCKSKIKGDNTVTQIYATLYLEKKNGSKWDYVDSWSDSVKEKSLTISDSCGNLGSGTYRVRTVGTVYSGSKSEPINDTSKEVTV